MIWQDLRRAARALLRTPGFLLIAVASMAIASGAVISSFSLLDAVAFRKLPVRNPDALVNIATLHRQGPERGLTLPMFIEFTRSRRVFSSMLGCVGGMVSSVERNGTRVRAGVWAVTGNFFSDLGVLPAAGRLLTPADVDLSTLAWTPVAVIGYGFWQRQYGGSPRAVGETIDVEGVRLVIVGVAPKGFTALGIAKEPDVTVPLTTFPLIAEGQTRLLTSRTSFWVGATGRLRDGIPFNQAQAELETLWPAIRQATLPPDYSGRQRDDFLAVRLAVTSGARGSEWSLRSRFEEPLRVLWMLALVTFLVACVNLATLMLSRAAAGCHEMAIRGALGASRWRIVAPVAAESLLITVVGTAAGWVLGLWSTAVLSTAVLRNYVVPTVLNTRPNAVTLCVAIGAAAAAVVVLSLPGAWLGSRPGLVGMVLKDGSRMVGTGRMGKSLVVCQLALSMVLLLNGGLLVRSLGQLRAVRPGFQEERVLVASLAPRQKAYATLDNDTYYPLLAQRVASVPGVEAVTLSNIAPGIAFDRKEPVAATSTATSFEVLSNLGVVSPGWFSTLRVPVVQGRGFEWKDNSRAQRVAIVSQSLAQRLFRGQPSLGQRIRVGTKPDRQGLEIVGVAGDVRLYNRRDPGTLTVYVPSLQEAGLVNWNELLVRAKETPSAVQAGVKEAVRGLGREDVVAVLSLEDLRARDIVQETIVAAVGGFFGSTVLLLAAIGLGGLMSYSITQRTREFGIRIAVGATDHQLVRMVLSEALSLLALAVCVGLPTALAAARVVRGLLFGVPTWDLTTVMAAVALLILTGGIAAFVPARRASRLRPSVALRT